MFLMVQQLYHTYSLQYLLPIAVGLMMESTFHVRFTHVYFVQFLSYFTGSDREIIANLSRGNYSLTVEATSIDNNALTASEVLSPVFVFGSDVVEGQSAAGIYVI